MDPQYIVTLAKRQPPSSLPPSLLVLFLKNKSFIFAGVDDYLIYVDMFLVMY